MKEKIVANLLASTYEFKTEYKDTIGNYRWIIINYLGPKLPVVDKFMKEKIHQHLKEHYCKNCGEYIYNPYTSRHIHHYHSRHYYKYIPIMKERIRVHNRLQIVEWLRKFPKVLRIMEGKILSRRIPSCRVWSITEWNMLYPCLYINEYNYGITTFNKHISDILFVPHIAL